MTKIEKEKSFVGKKKVLKSEQKKIEEVGLFVKMREQTSSRGASKQGGCQLREGK